MKTGMEYPLIGVVMVVVLVGLWNAWSAMQVDLSVAALNATIAGQAAPDAMLVGGQWIVKAIVGTIIGGTVTAGAIWLFTWARKEIRKQKAESRKSGWKPGPGAQWERGPRPVSEAEVMRMALLRSMAGQGQPPPQMKIIREGGEDEPQINF